MKQTIWIARHGNREDFIDPSWIEMASQPFNPALSPDGVEQAKALGQRLVGKDIRHIFASPFLRTVQTANYVAEAIALPIKIEAGLSEFLSFSLISLTPEILSLPALKQRFPRIDLEYTSRVTVRYPESEGVMLARSRQTIRQFTREFPENFLIVTHSSPIACMSRELLQQKIKIRRPLCGLVKLVKEGDRWTMECNGDISHLANLPDNCRGLDKFSDLRRKIILAQRVLLQ
ncbi:MAG: histidine phosphatase family protein [Cyanobacteria bacterium SBLK]|nr:histidine phosphatase family protein [Cyanobacteria bacterium SBLK]